MRQTNKNIYLNELLIDDPAICDWEGVDRDLAMQYISELGSVCLALTDEMNRLEPTLDNMVFIRLPMDVR